MPCRPSVLSRLDRISGPRPSGFCYGLLWCTALRRVLCRLWPSSVVDGMTTDGQMAMAPWRWRAGRPSLAGIERRWGVPLSNPLLCAPAPRRGDPVALGDRNSNGDTLARQWCAHCVRRCAVSGQPTLKKLGRRCSCRMPRTPLLWPHPLPLPRSCHQCSRVGEHHHSNQTGCFRLQPSNRTASSP